MGKQRIRRLLNIVFAVSTCFAFYGCGGTTEGLTEAQQSDIIIGGSQAGVTPFIASVQVAGRSTSQLAAVAFQITPQPNTVSQPVNVSWNITALKKRGYMQGNSIQLPVFGLYPDYQNQVTFQLTFNDGSTAELQSTITTTAYADPTGVYLAPTIVKARTPGSALGFDFFIMKSLLGPPVIVDTDGQVRWTVPGTSTQAVYFDNGQFVRGSDASAKVTLLQFDSTESTLPANLPQPLLSAFHHNLDPGPNGLLAEFNGTDELGDSFEDIVAEIAPFSQQPPFQTFDMASILTSYMLDHGDDPSLFVRPGVDWFHVNASTYDPHDKSVIISSRENFLIKLDYSTHDIIWILGDPTKYWYTFPSLRAKALTLDSDGLYPIGQHGVSITSDGYLMIMNDGLGSMSQPSGASPGLTRTFSAVSAYSIDVANMTAHEVWRFDYGQSVFSPICGSSYEAPGKTYLVNFSTAANFTQSRLVGLDSGLNVVFDFQYTQPTYCGAAWNAIPIKLENLEIN